MTDPVNQTRPYGVDRLLRRLGFALLPPRCLICDERGANGMDLCASCHDLLPYNRACCARCAMPTAIATEACGRCLRRPPPLGLTRAAFVYRAPLDRLLPRAKFHGDLSSAHLLARLMARELADAERPQALVPVPLHRDRLRQRGYDQGTGAGAAAGPRARAALARRPAAPHPRDGTAIAAGRAAAPAQPARCVCRADRGEPADARCAGRRRHDHRRDGRSRRRRAAPGGRGAVDVWVCARVP